MKKSFLLIAAIAAQTLSAMAQDIVTTKDGKELEVKILEVGTQDIKYKKYDYLDGPTFTISKNKILSISYANGETEIMQGSSMYTTENIYEGMRYKQYKDFYNTRDYIPNSTDPYSRFWAGAASFLIPGLGQGVAGEWGRGASFFLANVGLNLLARSGVREVYNYRDGYSYRVSPITYFALAADVALNIWSICDAVHVAKVKNMYFQDLRAQRTSLDFKVEPYFTYTPAGVQNRLQPSAGLSLKIDF